MEIFALVEVLGVEESGSTIGLGKPPYCTNTIEDGRCENKLLMPRYHQFNVTETLFTVLQ